MRLKARHELIYAGHDYLPGEIFDAQEQDALDLINSDMAQPFNLEDPSTALRDSTTPAPPPPATVTINPTEASYAFDGGNGTFAVTISGTGATSGWTASASDPWLVINAPPAGVPQLQSGTVNYTVNTNPDADRTGTITTNNVTFTLTQTAPATHAAPASGAVESESKRHRKW